MDERRGEVARAEQRVEHGAAHGRDGRRGDALGIAGQKVADLGERGTLDPLHENQRLALAGAVAVGARKAVEVRDGAEAPVLLEKRGGVGEVDGGFVRGARLMAVRRDEPVVGENLDGEGLAGRVVGAEHPSDVAVVAVVDIDEQRHEPPLGLVLDRRVDRHGRVE